VNLPVSPSACAFTIGACPFTLSADDAALMEHFRRRYQAFLAPAPAGLHIHFDITPGDTSLIDYPIRFDAGVLHFTDPRCVGSLNPIRGEARFRLTLAQPVGAVEYVLRTAIALLAFDAGGLLLHAAGLVRDGRGYAFFGHSGSGKTTAARVSTQARVLNDDLVVLTPVQNWDDGWRVHATPFSNPSQVPPAGPEHAPLAALLRLVQSKRVVVQAMPVAQAAAELLTSVPIIPLDPIRTPRLIDRVLSLVTAVPTARLHFLPDDSFWPAVLRATS
jgi:hypothetical protein